MLHPDLIDGAHSIHPVSPHSRQVIVVTVFGLQPPSIALAASDIMDDYPLVLTIELNIEVVHPDRTKDRHLETKYLRTDHSQRPFVIAQVPEVIGEGSF